MSPKRSSSYNAFVASRTKRKTISLGVKLKILKRCETGRGATAVGREFGVNESSVRNILKNKDKLLEEAGVTDGSATELTGTENIIVEEMESLLAAWVEEMKQSDTPLSQAVIMSKAKSLFDELAEKEGDESIVNTFTASHGWFYRFDRRYNLNSTTLKENEGSSPIMQTSSSFPFRTSHNEGLHGGRLIKITVVDDKQQQSPAPATSDVEITDASRPFVSQTKRLMSRSTRSRRSSRPMRKRQRLKRQSTGSSVEDEEIILLTDTDSMEPNSKATKSDDDDDNDDDDSGPHEVFEEAMEDPQSTKADMQEEKRTLTIPNHQVAVMSNMLSMWKAGRLCDCYISNGTTKIMVHKMVLGAVCPKVLHVLHGTSSNSSPTVILPSFITKEGMLAFAEYMYSGVLDLTQDILVQLKTIAQRLDMKDFEQLCKSELHKAKIAPIAPVSVVEAPIAVVETPQMTEPCSLSGLLPSSTQKTKDPRLSPNTILSPFLMLLKNMNNKYENRSNSKGAVSTDKLATVGGPSSSSSVPTLSSAPGATTEDQVIKIKTEAQSDEETVSVPSPKQLKVEPRSPVRDKYRIQDDLLIDFENITPNTGVGLQLAPDMVSVPSNMATITDLSPTTSNSIPYPVGLFASGGIKITPALQENCV